MDVARMVLCGALLMVSIDTSAQVSGGDSLPPYLNPDLDAHSRVHDLIGRMTLEEKVSQLESAAPAIPRLRIPEYNWWNECLHGVARAGLATVFPQAIGLGATWDSDLIFRVATAISDEARAKHHEFLKHGSRDIYEGLTFWSPNINIFRDPRWGRGQETYGEDPYLTGRLGVSFVRGLQGDDPHYLKLVATPKHFAVHSGPEPLRHTFDAVVDERDLRETYLPAFRACVVEGKAHSVMCAYNRFRGSPCCGSNLLLNMILRREWGFDGYVVSDCGAVQDIHLRHQVAGSAPEAAAQALKAGTDLNCGQQYRYLVEAVRKGLVGEETVDTAVARLFTARMKLGMFDAPERVPFAQIPYTVVDSKEHRDLARTAARKSIVLLKNDGNILPLRKSVKTIAVIGPNADAADVLFGNYNGMPSYSVTPLAGIRHAVDTGTRVLFAPGCDLVEDYASLCVIPAECMRTTIDGKQANGLRGEYFDNPDFAGKPLMIRADSVVEMNWRAAAPDPRLEGKNYTVQWTGELIPPVGGNYTIGTEGFGGYRLFVDDSLLAEFQGRHQARIIRRTVPLEKGRRYRIRLEFTSRGSASFMRLLWGIGGDPGLLSEAVKAAAAADVAIVVLGLSPTLEGEESSVELKGFTRGDRDRIDLPEPQELLLQKVHATGTPVVTVLLSGSALSVSWADRHVAAILEAWYPGQEGGNAIADVLFGDYNPAGRLPVTFYESLADLPPFEEYRMAGRTYRYFTGKALYGFGHGLSYTTFRYDNLRVPPRIRKGDPVEVLVDLINTGSREGEEVAQVYVSHSTERAPSPICALQGFRRVSLRAGERKTIAFTLSPEQLALMNAEGQWETPMGKIMISVGGRQPGTPALAEAATTGVLTSLLKIVE
jgi:beta-glucosidase